MSGSTGVVIAGAAETDQVWQAARPFHAATARGGGTERGGRRGPVTVAASSPPGQFEVPYGTFGPTTTFTIPALRYMKDYGMTNDQLRRRRRSPSAEGAAKNPRAAFRDPITVEDVLASRMVAYPFHLLECCLVTDGGGALVVASAERAAEFGNPPCPSSAPGESSETPMISQLVDFTRPGVRLAGQAAFAEAGISLADVGRL